nr:hypothetical protein [Austwickia chelonae]
MAANETQLARLLADPTTRLDAPRRLAATSNLARATCRLAALDRGHPRSAG